MKPGPKPRKPGTAPAQVAKYNEDALALMAKKPCTVWDLVDEAGIPEDWARSLFKTLYKEGKIFYAGRMKSEHPTGKGTGPDLWTSNKRYL